MNHHKTYRITKAKQKLAAGILLQARRDLRRFQTEKTTLERELYRDALSWVIDDSYRWPFSFLNVCRLLRLNPDELRNELVYEVSLGAIPYWSHRVGRLLRQFHLSLRQH